MTDLLPDDSRLHHDRAAAALFAGPGETRALGRALHWSATPIGPVGRWPAALRGAARIVLDAPGGMCLYAGRGFVTLYNDGFRAILGAKHPESFGCRASEVWPELWTLIEPQFETVLETGVGVHVRDVPFDVARLVSGAVERAWFDYTLSPVRDEGEHDSPGAVVALLAVVTETTSRVRTEHALAAERERLADIVRIAPAFMAVLRGPEHVIELTNAGFDALVGGRDVRGRPVADALPEASAQGFIDLLDAVLATGEPFVGREVPYRRPDSSDVESVRYVDFVYQALSEADGRRSGVFVHGVDITEQVLARREVELLLFESEDARDRIEAIMASIADAFYLVDRNWRFTHVNAAAEPMLQTTAGNLLGRTLWDAFPGVMGSVFETAYREAMATGRVTSAEAYYEPLGTFFEVRTYPWSGGIMVHFRDIGSRKQAEAEREELLKAAVAARADAELARAQAEVANAQLQEQALELEMQTEELQTASVELEERSEELQMQAALAETARAEAVSANRAKSEFLTVMSHELRTPLNAIDGYAELMELGIRGPVTDEQRQDLARIRKSEKHLLGLINGVLNYAQVEAGAVHYELTAVSVDEVLATCEPLVTPQAGSKALSLSRRPCNPSLAVRADREKLQQILLNLLSNAIKFTEAGGHIEIRCVELPDTGAGVLHIKVADTGIGIPANQLGRIFDPFVQVDSGFTRTREGTGLGLAISRDLARGMGGELTAESALGTGSVFTLRMPLVQMPLVRPQAMRST